MTTKRLWAMERQVEEIDTLFVSKAESFRELELEGDISFQVYHKVLNEKIAASKKVYDAIDTALLNFLMPAKLDAGELSYLFQDAYQNEFTEGVDHTPDDYINSVIRYYFYYADDVLNKAALEFLNSPRVGDDNTKRSMTRGLKKIIHKIGTFNDWSYDRFFYEAELDDIISIDRWKVAKRPKETKEKLTGDEENDIRQRMLTHICGLPLGFAATTKIYNDYATTYTKPKLNKLMWGLIMMRDTLHHYDQYPQFARHQVLEYFKSVSRQYYYDTLKNDDRFYSARELAFMPTAEIGYENELIDPQMNPNLMAIEDSLRKIGFIPKDAKVRSQLHIVIMHAIATGNAPLLKHITGGNVSLPMQKTKYIDEDGKEKVKFTPTDKIPLYAVMEAANALMDKTMPNLSAVVIEYAMKSGATAPKGGTNVIDVNGEEIMALPDHGVALLPADQSIETWKEQFGLKDITEEVKQQEDMDPVESIAPATIKQKDEQNAKAKENIPPPRPPSKKTQPTTGGRASGKIPATTTQDNEEL